jgi:hypothetical protein
MPSQRETPDTKRGTTPFASHGITLCRCPVPAFVLIVFVLFSFLTLNHRICCVRHEQTAQQTDGFSCRLVHGVCLRREVRSLSPDRIGVGSDLCVAKQRRRIGLECEGAAPTRTRSLIGQEGKQLCGAPAEMEMEMERRQTQRKSTANASACMGAGFCGICPANCLANFHDC